jgi:hypothetical protein
MLPVTDEHKFWDLTSASEHIFAYLRKEIPELTRTNTWAFDRGNVSYSGDVAYAKFSCTGASPPLRDVLTISATKQPGGGWAISHTVERAAG